jgi:hypothetical protein
MNPVTKGHIKAGLTVAGGTLVAAYVIISLMKGTWNPTKWKATPTAA